MDSAKKRVRYSDHLQFRLRLREIDAKLPEKIYRFTDERYYDRATGLLIAVKKVRSKGKFRDIAVTYRETDKEALLITIHPLKQRQKENRLQTNRWRKI